MKYSGGTVHLFEIFVVSGQTTYFTQRCNTGMNSLLKRSTDQITSYIRRSGSASNSSNLVIVDGSIEQTANKQ
jgi:hypothetical protein